MAIEASVRVNFSKPIPLFPLDRGHLLPQQIVPLHIFEPRYRQMITHALDGAGQIAMAMFDSRDWKKDYHGRPELRDAVCIGQIGQHERLPDGRFNVILQGICRARIVEESPGSSERLYRQALLQPIGFDEADPEELTLIRSRLSSSLSSAPLDKLNVSKPILDCARDSHIPTTALLELLGFTIINNNELRYKLLAEGDAILRAEMIFSELSQLSRLIHQADRQRPQDWPKGCSWN